ncbi:Unknown protein, partial [Striga hermonthica]
IGLVFFFVPEIEISFISFSLVRFSYIIWYQKSVRFVMPSRRQDAANERSDATFNDRFQQIDYRFQQLDVRFTDWFADISTGIEDLRLSLNNMIVLELQMNREGVVGRGNRGGDRGGRSHVGAPRQRSPTPLNGNDVGDFGAQQDPNAFYWHVKEMQKLDLCRGNLVVMLVDGRACFAWTSSNSTKSKMTGHCTMVRLCLMKDPKRWRSVLPTKWTISTTVRRFSMMSLRDLRLTNIMRRDLVRALVKRTAGQKNAGKKSTEVGSSATSAAVPESPKSLQEVTTTEVPPVVNAAAINQAEPEPNVTGTEVAVVELPHSEVQRDEPEKLSSPPKSVESTQLERRKKRKLVKMSDVGAFSGAERRSKKKHDSGRKDVEKGVDESPLFEKSFLSIDDERAAKVKVPEGIVEEWFTTFQSVKFPHMSSRIDMPENAKSAARVPLMVWDPKSEVGVSSLSSVDKLSYAKAFDTEIKGMHIEAYEDEREFCEWMLRRSEEMEPNSDLPPLTEDRAALLRRAYVNMILEGEKGKRKELTDIFVSTLADVEIEHNFDEMTLEQIRGKVEAYIAEKAKSKDKEVEIIKVVTPAGDQSDEVRDPRDDFVPVSNEAIETAAKAKEVA